MVINQALAAGLPIIATDAVGAASDLVTSGKQGLIIPPCNSRALQDAMLTLLTNPQLRQRQSDAARHSGKELDPDHGAARWSSILTEVTHPNAPALTS